MKYNTIPASTIAVIDGQTSESGRSGKRTRDLEGLTYEKKFLADARKLPQVRARKTAQKDQESSEDDTSDDSYMGTDDSDGDVDKIRHQNKRLQLGKWRGQSLILIM